MNRVSGKKPAGRCGPRLYTGGRRQPFHQRAHKMKRKEKPRRESPFTMGYGVPTDADLARVAPSMLDMGVPIEKLMEHLLMPPINIHEGQ